MNYPEYFALALVVFGLSAYVAYEWLKLRRKIKDILATPTSQIASLLNGPKTRQGQTVEVKGMVMPAGPILNAPYTDRDCVFYHSVKKDKVKEVSRDLGGKTRSHIRYNTVEELRSTDLFYVEDHTGKIAVDPAGLEIEGVRVMNTEKSCDGNPGAGFLGIFRPPEGDYYMAVLKEEHILPPKKRVYLIGQLFQGRQGPFIGAPVEKTTTAFLSVKTEETLVEENRRQLYFYTAAWALAVIAGVFFIGMSR
ncbi:MAG: GIDE domain-containing protein [Candidatus Riflebacteria bacterium]|nr:GIDE domain-containing protein [Candidatus Riflebacteria bacterium]